MTTTKQKFPALTFVRINKVLPEHKRYHDKGFKGIIMGSYAE